MEELREAYAYEDHNDLRIEYYLTKKVYNSSGGFVCTEEQIVTQPAFETAEKYMNQEQLTLKKTVTFPENEPHFKNAEKDKERRMREWIREEIRNVQPFAYPRRPGASETHRAHVLVPETDPCLGVTFEDGPADRSTP